MVNQDNEVVKVDLNETDDTLTHKISTTTEKKKKKNKNKNRKKKKKSPLDEPSTLNDELNYTYNYGNVINVKVDTSKPWTEATLGKYLKDSGFVKGSYNTPSNKAQMTPFYVKFANKLLSRSLSQLSNCLISFPLPEAGNGKDDLEKAYDSIGSPMFEGIMLPFLPPSDMMMGTLLVVAAYVMGFPRFGRGSIPDVIKTTLVQFCSEIPRDLPDLSAKIKDTFNRFFGHVDNQLKVVWDKNTMTQYLLNNGIRKYSTTKYPPAQDNFNIIIELCRMIKKTIIRSNPDNYIRRFTQETSLELVNVIPNETVESALDRLGRMSVPSWNPEKGWPLDQTLRQCILGVTLLAFETGVVNYIHPGLIDGCIKKEIVAVLEFPCFDDVDDLPTASNRINSILADVIINHVYYIEEFKKFVDQDTFDYCPTRLNINYSDDD
ncbi:hypothetical protein DFA_11196 [Cavenderia fasciculata]|uniref:Uncharacterized protein n=1 Tax=Cavenderia fasciculata TaxID=261658 RepID=F4QFC8_CACFS|nr:uncharacterized protein DFA_11196 [Cavenderia fasciculata]EGG13435.1 hypothetical protein DFA_11196 [Cavenderia fasciculata]|eukprot:XP_004350139.1 hypothetical protein DFA_11196 [Cavenderia fasciculata]